MTQPLAELHGVLCGGAKGLTALFRATRAPQAHLFARFDEHQLKSLKPCQLQVRLFGLVLLSKKVT
jgi:hypothetical protein